MSESAGPEQAAIAPKVFDCADPQDHIHGVREAVYTVRRGGLVVLPTDTVYGVGADAFTPSAVAALLAAKGRGRDMPPPVLIGALPMLDALAETVTPTVRALIEAFWPGALTIIVRSGGSLAWDLGDTRGTVALRMPDHELAMEVLRETGPMAVSSANRTGLPAATTCASARSQLGDAVSVYLDGGPTDDTAALPSSIVDLTGERPRLLRTGALTLERLREVVPDLEPTA